MVVVFVVVVINLHVLFTVGDSVVVVTHLVVVVVVYVGLYGFFFVVVVMLSRCLFWLVGVLLGSLWFSLCLCVVVFFLGFLLMLVVGYGRW